MHTVCTQLYVYLCVVCVCRVSNSDCSALFFFFSNYPNMQKAQRLLWCVCVTVYICGWFCLPLLNGIWNLKKKHTHTQKAQRDKERREAEEIRKKEKREADEVCENSNFM